MRTFAITLLVIAVTNTVAVAQAPAPGEIPVPAPAPGDAPPAPTDAPPAPTDAPAPKQPKRGDFDAGGQLRLPSGPDEMGAYATWNWVALDLRGRYYLLDTVTVTGNAPVAVIKPSMVGGIEPSMIGGMTVTLDARLPKMDVPFAPKAKDTEVSLVLTGAYMREGAMLLSEKDFPMFVGDFKPGFTAGSVMKVRLSSLFDFSLAPVFVYQAGSAESTTAVQLPTSTIIKLGSVLKLSADLGVFTGDDYSFSGDGGGRIYAGGALDVKLGPIITHAGAGVASLLTGGAYPTIRDSVYIDLNVKYAK